MVQDTIRIGNTFGLWTVMKLSYRDNTSHKVWQCKCNCGTIRDVKDESLRSGKSHSCGCRRGIFISNNVRAKLQGKKFGRLKVLKLDKLIKKRTYWRCQCDCGKIISVRGTNLNNHNTSSCGCLQKENAKYKNQKPFGYSTKHTAWSGLNLSKMTMPIKEFEKWIEKAYHYIQNGHK